MKFFLPLFYGFLALLFFAPLRSTLHAQNNQCGITANPTIVNPVCNGSGGSLMVDVMGGTAPYTYFWFHLDSLPVSSPNGNSLTDLFAGPHQLIVQDANGCIASFDFNVTTDNSFVLEATPINPVCPGDPGSITLTTTGGTPPYTYSYDIPGDPTVDNGVISPVPSGFYFITVTDAIGCTGINSVFVSPAGDQFVFPFTDPATCGYDNGFAGVEVNQDATVLWSNGATDCCLENLAPGTYSVTVTYPGGCPPIVEEVVVETLDSLIVDIIGANTLECITGERQLAAFIFNAPDVGLNYSWSGPNGLISNGSDSTIIADQAGTYIVTVTTLNGQCTATASIVMTNLQNAETNTFVFTDSCGFGPLLVAQLNGNFVDVDWQTPDGPILNSSQITAPSVGWYVWTLQQNCFYTDSVFIADPIGDCGQLFGTVFLDQGDCTLDAGDQNLSQVLVRATSTTGSGTYFDFTDDFGSFEISLEAGTYEVEAVIPGGLYANCIPLPTVTIAPGGGASANLPVVALAECARLEVDLTIPFLRRCFTTGAYLSYVNNGTVTAEDATITLTMDDFVSLASASVPFTTVGDQIVFDLGDVPALESGFINLQFATSCDAVLGQAHCISAAGFPDEPCPVPSSADWMGASVQTAGNCDGDEVSFRISNLGTGAMTVPLAYIVIEDGVMIREVVDSPSLAPSEFVEVTFPANGSTYRLEAMQEPGHPGLMFPAGSVEGCTDQPNGTFSTGFLTQFPSSDDVFWLDEECLQNIGAYDPNDKQASPRGYGDQHYIRPGQPLEFTVRFQNTGTDTAFTVVIRDVIQPEFDLSTLEMTSTSHDYRVDVDSSRMLTITFPQINLVDSFTNVAGSQGAISYRIRPRADLPLGTRMENTAGIYFDFNEPVITNTTFHTVEEEFIPVGLRRLVNDDPARLLVAPNPARAGSTIQLNGLAPTAFDRQVRIYDGIGREVSRSILRGGGVANLLLSANLTGGRYWVAVYDRSGRALGIGSIDVVR